MRIDVPDDIYEEFCMLLDAGVQFVTEGVDAEEFTEAEKQAIRFVEEREWEI